MAATSAVEIQRELDGIRARFLSDGAREGSDLLPPFSMESIIQLERSRDQLENPQPSHSRTSNFFAASLISPSQSRSLLTSQSSRRQLKSKSREELINSKSRPATVRPKSAKCVLPRCTASLASRGDPIPTHTLRSQKDFWTSLRPTANQFHSGRDGSFDVAVQRSRLDETKQRESATKTRAGVLARTRPPIESLLALGFFAAQAPCATKPSQAPCPENCCETVVASSHIRGSFARVHDQDCSEAFDKCYRDPSLQESTGSASTSSSVTGSSIPPTHSSLLASSLRSRSSSRSTCFDELLQSGSSGMDVRDLTSAQTSLARVKPRRSQSRPLAIGADEQSRVVSHISSLGALAG